jgi:hypothetical protein
MPLWTGERWKEGVREVIEQLHTQHPHPMGRGSRAYRRSLDANPSTY